jgi:hypothetical protein
MDGSAVVMMEKSSAARKSVNCQSGGQCDVSCGSMCFKWSLRHTNNTHRMIEVRNLEGDMIAYRKKLYGGEDDMSYAVSSWQRHRMQRQIFDPGLYICHMQ